MDTCAAIMNGLYASSIAFPIDTALDIASVDEIIFIRAVAARDQRLTDEAAYPDRISSGIHLNQVCRDLASKDRINYIFLSYDFQRYGDGSGCY